MGKAHAVRRRGGPTWGVFPDKEKQGGGPLIDIGTHALDLTLWFMDNYKPKSVFGSTYQNLKEKHPTFRYRWSIRVRRGDFEATGRRSSSMD